MIASINCQSLEKLVIDDEMCASAYRLIEGITMETGTVIAGLVDAMGPGGQFLSQKHTRENLRKEHHMPSDVICRLSPEKWKQEGSRDIVERAREIVNKRLTEHEPTNLSPESEERLQAVFSQILQKHGISRDQIPRGV